MRKPKEGNKRYEQYYLKHNQLAIKEWPQLSRLQKFFFKHLSLWRGERFKRNWALSEESFQEELIDNYMGNLTIGYGFKYGEFVLQQKQMNKDFDVKTQAKEGSAVWKYIEGNFPWVYIISTYEKQKYEFRKNRRERFMRIWIQEIIDSLESQITFMKVQEGIKKLLRKQKERRYKFRWSRKREYFPWTVTWKGKKEQVMMESSLILEDKIFQKNPKVILKAL